MIRPDWETGELPPIPKKKQKTHSKHAPESAREIRQHLKHLKRINGVDLSLMDGFRISLAQSVTMEVRSDVSEKFPTEKHFCSWLGVAPRHEISGGKVLKNKTLKTQNRAGPAFRMAAQSAKTSDSVFGVMYKRLRARQGPSHATVSTAHAIARAVYQMLTLAPRCGCSAGEYQVEYEAISVNEYDAKRLLHLEEVRRTASQVFQKESCEVGLPTRPCLTQVCGRIKRLPQVERRLVSV